MYVLWFSVDTVLFLTFTQYPPEIIKYYDFKLYSDVMSLIYPKKVSYVYYTWDLLLVVLTKTEQILPNNCTLS